MNVYSDIIISQVRNNPNIQQLMNQLTKYGLATKWNIIQP